MQSLVTVLAITGAVGLSAALAGVLIAGGWIMLCLHRHRVARRRALP